MLAALLLGLGVIVVADEPGGWPDLFPTLGNFDRKVKAPVIAKGDKPEAYSQSTKYEWLGGRFEILTITIARDPAFKEKYAADAVKKTKPAPTSVEVNKKRAYLWESLAKPDDLVNVNKRLVVILADDKVLMVEQVGFGLELEDVAKKLDFEKVAKALESVPAKK
jgi:hypothetical protein